MITPGLFSCSRSFSQRKSLNRLRTLKSCFRNCVELVRVLMVYTVCELMGSIAEPTFVGSETVTRNVDLPDGSSCRGARDGVGVACIRTYSSLSIVRHVDLREGQTCVFWLFRLAASLSSPTVRILAASLPPVYAFSSSW